MEAAIYQESRKDSCKPEPECVPHGKSGLPEAPCDGETRGFAEPGCNARSQAAKARKSPAGCDSGGNGEAQGNPQADSQGNPQTHPSADAVRDSEAGARGHSGGRINAHIEAQTQAGRDDHASAVRPRPE